VPNDPKHVVYVWLDALTNYLTVNGYPDIEDQTANKYWQNVIHFVGKEIVRFHAVYWPAFLMAVEINPPKQIVSHGWWLSEGEKMSKSQGNVQDPAKYCKLFGSDALRYFLLSELSFGEDGNFSIAGFIARYNAILAHSYGNLCNRVFSFIKNHLNSRVARIINKEIDLDIKYIEAVNVTLQEAIELFKGYAFNKYIQKIEHAMALSNQYVDFQKPWALKDIDPARTETILFTIANGIHRITSLLFPIIPISADKVFRQMNAKLAVSNDVQPSEFIIGDIEPLFPKIDASSSSFDVFE
jgi:methionyl-tRNA synthetase